jgi:hypothetical protein
MDDNTSISAVFRNTIVRERTFTFIFCERYANVTRFFLIERERERSLYFSEF